MQTSPFRALAIVGLFATSRLNAQLPLVANWNTCTIVSGLNACASLDLYREGVQPTDPPHANWFFGNLNSGNDPSGFRITAWGFYFPYPTDLTLELTYGPSNWGLGPTAWGGGYLLTTGAVDWDDALGGPNFSGEGFAGWWEGTTDLSELRFAWRGVLDDQSLTFDCIQSGPGDPHACVSVAPEPSTWVLLLSGLFVLALFGRAARSSSSATEGNN